jgi:two-component system, OmpR family, KDP operon response regulator KdpE
VSANEKTPILIVDDEPPIRRLLRASLTANDFRVLEAGSGMEGMAEIGRHKPELVLLDLSLPDMDGLDIIARLRSAGDRTPVLVLSSRGEERIKVAALEAGADDYVTKPFGMAELIARIRTALRHKLQTQGVEPVFESGNLRVDLLHRQVKVDGAEVKLSPKEYDILRQLVLHAGKVLTHRFLIREVWGGAGEVQYLRIYVRQLRAKIEARPEQPVHILTETGVGYRLQL